MLFGRFLELHFELFVQFEFEQIPPVFERLSIDIQVKVTQCIMKPEIKLTVAKNNSWRVTKNNSKTVKKKLFRKGAKNNPYIVKKIICRMCQKFMEGNEEKARQNVTIYVYVVR